MVFRLVPTSVTLNDLERRNSPYFLFSPNSIVLQDTSQWLKIDLYYLQNIVFHFWPIDERLRESE